MATTKRYRTPTATATCEISLNDFDENDIIEFVKHEGLMQMAGNFQPSNLIETQKLELFIEKQENIPIADFIAFFNRY